MVEPEDGMTTSKRVRAIEQASADLEGVLRSHSDGHDTRTLLGHALVRLQDARPALPGAQSYDSDRVSSSVSGNPPRGFDAVDPTEVDRRLADELIRRLQRDADALVRLVERWQPREATPKDRTLAAANMAYEPGCEHCATIGQWASIYKPQTTCNGNTERKMGLCAFCYRYTLDVGELPSRKQLEDHHNGVRVKRPA